ncbi:HeH/LEM domain-containing protein [Enterococcus italicus]|nr:HeH/LEM domain-containing protein [Enterococcus italicus]MDN6491102.1 HeH/LEM domain-containing protein [Leuconostoc sp.]
MAQLKSLLDERRVTYPSNALKADLVELLEE